MQHQWLREPIKDRAGRWAVEVVTWVDVNRWIEEKLVGAERDWEEGMSPSSFTHPTPGTPYHTTLVGFLRFLELHREREREGKAD
jgi:hypothetical protein